MPDESKRRVFLRDLSEHFDDFCEKRVEEILLTLSRAEEQLPEIQCAEACRDDLWALIGDQEKSPELWVCMNDLEHALGLKDFACGMVLYRQGVQDGIDMMKRIAQEHEKPPDC